jgi:hypothetical protein
MISTKGLLFGKHINGFKNPESIDLISIDIVYLKLNIALFIVKVELLPHGLIHADHPAKDYLKL